MSTNRPGTFRLPLRGFEVPQQPVEDLLIRLLPWCARSTRGRVQWLSRASMSCSVTSRKGKAHQLRWALLYRNFVGTPLNPDSVSTTARNSLARIPIAHWEGLHSPHWVSVSGHYRTQTVVLLSILTQ
jgi:hypothetical protein